MLRCYLVCVVTIETTVLLLNLNLLTPVSENDLITKKHNDEFKTLSLNLTRFLKVKYTTNTRQ